MSKSHGPLRVGIGGPVGSGKTALMDLLCKSMRERYDIAAITNLSPEHTDWHRTVERYYADKLNLVDRDAPFPVALGHGALDHPLVMAALRDRKRLIPPLAPFLHDRIASAVSRSRLKGEHNLGNALLAAQVALKAGADIEGVIRGIHRFVPLPHRLEEHRFGGIAVVNDSISTTPEATKAALAASTAFRMSLRLPSPTSPRTPSRPCTSRL